MATTRNSANLAQFNKQAHLPYQLRLQDFQMGMQDVYDFFFDVNSYLAKKGLQRLDDMLRPAIMSGMLSDMLTSSMAKHSRVLTQNCHFNGHPDLVVQGVYPGNAIKAGSEGVEIKTTRKSGGAVDTHGARDQWTFTEVYLGKVTVEDFRKNPRGELGTRTATLHREGIKKLRENWIYRL
jgi:hypothetical protein